MNSDVNLKYRHKDWYEIDWKHVEKSIFKLQKRIFKASQENDAVKVKRLQKLLATSYYGKLWSIRKVTQENNGNKTAGIDHVRNISAKQKLELVSEVKLDGQSSPIKRVSIPKKDRGIRELGIPTIKDRTKQCLAKLILEPEWEAKFEGNSYGFRPSRSCHDAIEAIHNSLKYQDKYVLDADIEKCFDRIDHNKLLNKLNTSYIVRRQVKAWLKCGVMVKGNLESTNRGTPQGGIISPLLANIVLNGMEEAVMSYIDTVPLRSKWSNPKLKGYRNFLGKMHKRQTLGFIRYADDFVILHEEKYVVLKCQEIIEEFLKEYGLRLKEDKTRIGHSLKHMNGKAGFEFLGFEIRQFPVTEHSSGRCNKKPLGFKTIIKPSKESVKRHIKDIGDFIRNHRTISQEQMIIHLNRLIRGWANYYRTVCSKKVFSEISNILYWQLKRWAERRHPKKGKKWVKDRYWHTVGGNHWVFCTKRDGEVVHRLKKHYDFEIKRHVQVKTNKSKFDGDWAYWGRRLKEYVGLSKTNARLIKIQNGRCNKCGLMLTTNDLIDIDHIVPTAMGGKDILANKQLLHKQCHVEKTRTDRVAIKRYQLESGKV